MNAERMSVEEHTWKKNMNNVIHPCDFSKHIKIYVYLVSFYTDGILT